MGESGTHEVGIRTEVKRNEGAVDDEAAPRDEQDSLGALAYKIESHSAFRRHVVMTAGSGCRVGTIEPPRPGLPARGVRVEPTVPTVDDHLADLLVEAEQVAGDVRMCGVHAEGKRRAARHRHRRVRRGHVIERLSIDAELDQVREHPAVELDTRSRAQLRVYIERVVSLTRDVVDVRIRAVE